MTTAFDYLARVMEIVRETGEIAAHKCRRGEALTQIDLGAAIESVIADATVARNLPAHRRAALVRAGAWTLIALLEHDDRARKAGLPS